MSDFENIGQRDGAWPRVVLGLAWALVVTLVLIGTAARNLLPDAPDKWTYDWRTYFFSEQAQSQRNDIALVLINEETLADYPYSVVDRGLLAVVVRALDEAGAKAIGLDFVFERPTEPAKDVALIEAITEATRPIVLAAIDERARVSSNRSLDYQQSFFERAGVSREGRVKAGHAFFSRLPDRLTAGDQVVRFMSAPLASATAVESFARVLADLNQPRVTPASPYIDWLLPPPGAAQSFGTIRVPQHLPGLTARDTAKVLPVEWRAALTGKIVLVGAEFIDRDRHLTPLSVADKLPVPGVTIHAQILAQLHDGRSVFELSGLGESIAVFALVALGYALGWRARIYRFGSAAYMVGLIALALAGVMMFAYWKLMIPTTTLLIAWLAGVSGGQHSGWVWRHFSRRFRQQGT